ncbi:MAG: glycoside hydrolase family 32 protein [Actinomycetes bacterium]
MPDADELEGPERPHVHFTPPSGWLNDPNGLVYVDGTWQLCYQHHPDSLVWGPMHWGRATSRDLLRWEHQPLVLRPDRLGAAFSGSAVVDADGVAGFGADALVAFYTHFLEGEPQTQGVVSSADGGRTWTPHPGNPVLRGPEGLVDFRDPKVLRYGGPGADGHWVMVLVGGPEVIFHRSDDLLTWTECGRFGREYGAHGGLWETPDLFELDVEGTGERRWVLVVSVMAGGPAGGTGTQYFTGTFDGATFTCDGPPDEVRWVDHGADFYAPQSWFGAPDGRRTWIAWMSNWAYARAAPASTWRGAMTLPRDLALRPGPDGRPVLVQRPAPELDAHGPAPTTVLPRTGKHSFSAPLSEAAAAVWGVAEAPEAYEVVVRAGDAASWSVEVHRDEALGRATRVSWDASEPDRPVLTVQRDDRGLVGVDPAGGQVVALPELGPGDVTEVRVVVDTCSVEVFAAGGAVVLTHQVFPAPDARGLRLTAPAGVLDAALTLRDLTTH